MVLRFKKGVVYTYEGDRNKVEAFIEFIDTGTIHLPPRNRARTARTRTRAKWQLTEGFGWPQGITRCIGSRRARSGRP